LLGGTTPDGRTTNGWSTKPGPDGTLEAWAPLPALPRPLDSFAAVAGGNGWIYITGGFFNRDDGSLGVSNEVYAAPFGTGSKIMVLFFASSRSIHTPSFNIHSDRRL